MKAQIHSGARGKAGGIKLCANERGDRGGGRSCSASKLVTHQTGPAGKLVSRLYVEEAANIEREIYLGFVLDRKAERIMVVASAAGGMEIEEIAATPARHHHPRQWSSRRSACSRSRRARSPSGSASIPRSSTSRAARSSAATARSAISTPHGGDQSAGRHQGRAGPRARRQDDVRRQRPVPPAARRRAARQEPGRSARDPAAERGLNYVGLEGDIGCIVNGAGLAMATMDMIKHAGGEPANFLDIGGGASPERVAQGVQAGASDKNVKAILVNIFAGINRCDWVAKGVVEAVKELEITVPLVVRLAGTNVEEGRKILADSGLTVITADTLAEAAQKAVAARKKPALSHGETNAMSNLIDENTPVLVQGFTGTRHASTRRK